MKKFNVGVIGYGWVAGAHIDSINSTTQGQVTAVYSSRKLDAAELNTKHGSEIACHTNLKKMLSDPSIDVISICSYPQYHAKQVIAAAEAGKHLIIEKPLALNLKDLSNLIDDKIIQKLDHKNINLDVDFMKGKMASTEVLAMSIWQELAPDILKMGGVLHCVRLQETENNFVEYYGQ